MVRNRGLLAKARDLSFVVLLVNSCNKFSTREINHVDHCLPFPTPYRGFGKLNARGITGFIRVRFADFSSSYVIMG